MRSPAAQQFWLSTMSSIIVLRAGLVALIVGDLKRKAIAFM